MHTLPSTYKARPDMADLVDWGAGVLLRLNWQRWMSCEEIYSAIHALADKVFPPVPGHRVAGREARREFTHLLTPRGILVWEPVGLLRLKCPPPPHSPTFTREMAVMRHTPKEHRGCRPEMLFLLEQCGGLRKRGKLWLTK